MIVHGVKSDVGLRDYQEDTHVTVSNLMESLLTPVYFYAVYDGHGGDCVSKHAADTLHKHIRVHIENGTSRRDALSNAFRDTDDALRNVDDAGTTGCTAATALIDDDHVWVAHAGDSRVLLCRNAECHALTQDHRPSADAERQRITDSGGFVMNDRGVHRVMGILAVSRAIGDHNMRPFGVTAVPDITIVSRNTSDEFLLLATDGLFDVMTNEEAVELTRKSLARCRDRGASRSAAARITANVMVRMAANKGSQDNVTVIVVAIADPSE